MPEVRESAETAASADDSRQHPAARILHAAYPPGRERDRAIRWLAWMAGRMDAGRNLAWWDIPAWIGEPRLRFARTLTGAVLLGLAFGLGFGGYAGPSGLAAGPLAGLAAAYISNRLRPGKLGKSPDGQHGATSVELDLARRLGKLQAVTLAPRPPDITQAEAAATRQAGFDAPAAGPDEVNQRLAGLDSAEKKDDATERLADQAAELAAAAVAKALQLPGLGDTEVVQVIREYLSGLIENSPVKDVFAAWAGRIAGRSAPRPAAEIVVPDPQRLKDAAATAATSELARTPVTDPAAVGRFLGQTAVVAAVDLANQVRYLQEGSGPCDGCARPEPPGDRHGQGPEDHPFEPPEIVP